MKRRYFFFIILLLLFALTHSLIAADTFRITGIGSYFFFQDDNTSDYFAASKFLFGLGLSFLPFENIEVKTSYALGQSDLESSILHNEFTVEVHHFSFDANYLFHLGDCFQPYLGFGVEYLILRQYVSTVNPSMHNIWTSSIGYALIGGIYYFPTTNSNIFVNLAMRYNLISSFDKYDIDMSGFESVFSIGVRF